MEIVVFTMIGLSGGSGIHKSNHYNEIMSPPVHIRTLLSAYEQVVCF